jgi:hypothetical protein
VLEQKNGNYVYERTIKLEDRQYGLRREYFRGARYCQQVGRDTVRVSENLGLEDNGRGCGRLSTNGF